MQRTEFFSGELFFTLYVLVFMGRQAESQIVKPTYVLSSRDRQQVILLLYVIRRATIAGTSYMDEMLSGDCWSMVRNNVRVSLRTRGYKSVLSLSQMPLLPS